MKHLKPICGFAGLTIILVGCSSPKDASLGNFKKVINGYFDRNCITVSPRNSKFPVTVELLPSDSKWAEKQNPEKTQQYDALVGIGILDVKDGSAEVKKSIFSAEKITVGTKTYSLSEKGKELLIKNTETNLFGGSSQGFCVANYKVNEVSNFSEPSQAMGYTISKVNYSISPKNVKEWASNEIIIKSFPRVVSKLEAGQEKSTTLVLMNDGWVHEKEMKR